jgi:GMP synthase-like glutamine amidotransferase
LSLIPKPILTQDKSIQHHNMQVAAVRLASLGGIGTIAPALSRYGHQVQYYILPNDSTPPRVADFDAFVFMGGPMSVKRIPCHVRLDWSAPCRNQVFRIGRFIYGLQIHLEVIPDMIVDWQRQDAD